MQFPLNINIKPTARKSLLPPPAVCGGCVYVSHDSGEDFAAGMGLHGWPTKLKIVVGQSFIDAEEKSRYTK